MSQPQANPRLELLFASDSPKAVILRRGPSKVVACILWNRETDALQIGSWFFGQIRGYKSGLSPSGDFLIYQASDYRETHGLDAFTAICKPPNLHPLQLWLHSSTWVGGGRFLDKDHFFRFAGTGKQPKAQFDPIPGLTDATDESEAFFSNITGSSEEDAQRQEKTASQYSVVGFRLYRGSEPSDESLIADLEDITYDRDLAPFHDGKLRESINLELRGEW